MVAWCGTVDGTLKPRRSLTAREAPSALIWDSKAMPENQLTSVKLTCVKFVTQLPRKSSNFTRYSNQIFLLAGSSKRNRYSWHNSFSFDIFKMNKLLGTITNFTILEMERTFQRGNLFFFFLQTLPTTCRESRCRSLAYLSPCLLLSSLVTAVAQWHWSKLSPPLSSSLSHVILTFRQIQSPLFFLIWGLYKLHCASPSASFPPLI